MPKTSATIKVDSCVITRCIRETSSDGWMAIVPVNVGLSCTILSRETRGSSMVTNANTFLKAADVTISRPWDQTDGWILVQSEFRHRLV
jgi:hypothetical protein